MSNNAAFRAVRRLLLLPAVADQGCSGTGDARETALTTAPSHPRGTTIRLRPRPKHGHGQTPPARAAWVILACLLWVGLAMVPGGACAELPEDAAASKLAPEAGVHYYSYIRFRPAGTDSFTDGCDIGSADDSALAEGDYLFQILVLPANAWHGKGVSPKEPYNRLQSPWGAIRGRIEVGKSEGKPVITYRGPLVTGNGGTAPVNALKIGPDKNLWGRDETGKNTFGEALPLLSPIVRLGAGGAAPVTNTEQELALLRALCDSNFEQPALNESATLFRVDRGLAQPTPALAALSLFVAPDEPIAPSLDALLERIKDDPAFTRAGYLQGEPDGDYKQLFDAFRERLQALSADAAGLAEERRSNAADAERREQLIAECRTGPERGCQSDCLEFLTDEQRKDCPRADVSGRTGSQGDGGPGGSKLGVLLLALLALALAALLAFLVLARRAERAHNAEYGAPEHTDRASFVKRLPGLLQPDDRRTPRGRREQSAAQPVKGADSGSQEMPGDSQDDLRAQVAALHAKVERVNKQISPMVALGAQAKERNGRSADSADLHAGLEDVRKELGALNARVRRLEERPSARTSGVDDPELTDRVRRLVAEMRPTSDQPRTVRSDIDHKLKGLRQDLLAALSREQNQALLERDRRLGKLSERLGSVESGLQRVSELTSRMAHQRQSDHEPQATKDRPDLPHQPAPEVAPAARGPSVDGSLSLDDPLRWDIASASSRASGTRYPSAAEDHAAPVSASPEPSAAASDSRTGLPAPTTAPPSAERLRDQLQRTLETLKVFQPEGWEDLWEAFSEQRLDQFLKQLVGLYLPDNLPERALEEIDTWLADAFGGRAGLIRPRPGDALDSTAHRAVSTVPRSQGAFNIVHSLIRAGARCDERVVRQAQVVRVA